MKKLTLLLIVLVALFATTAVAKTVTLSWDPSPGTDVAGYNIYYGIDETSMTAQVDAGNSLTVVIPDLVDEIGYYFTATAYNQVGLESIFSNTVYSPGFAPPPPPVALGGITTINNIDVQITP